MRRWRELPTGKMRILEMTKLKVKREEIFSLFLQGQQKNLFKWEMSEKSSWSHFQELTEDAKVLVDAYGENHFFL